MTLKKQLRRLLESGRLDEIGELAVTRRRTFGVLISLTFDRDGCIGWRAVEAMGVAAGRIAAQEPETVRDHLRRLYWLLSEESGGICWRAPEAIAEVVRQSPAEFSDYGRMVVSLIEEMAEEDLEHFRPGVLWAIGRLGPLCEPHLDEVRSSIVACLDHEDPQVRGMAAWCLGQCGHGALLSDRDDLASDEGRVAFYDDGRLRTVTVRQLAGCHGETRGG